MGKDFPESLWMFHPWKYSRPCWNGLRTTWSSGTYLCPWQWCWNLVTFQALFNTKHYFCDSITVLSEICFSELNQVPKQSSVFLLCYRRTLSHNFRICLSFLQISLLTILNGLLSRLINYPLPTSECNFQSLTALSLLRCAVKNGQHSQKKHRGSKYSKVGCRGHKRHESLSLSLSV